MSNIGYDPASGMPAPVPGSAAAAATMPIQPAIGGVPQDYVVQREHYIFTLPVAGPPASWKRPDADRTFALTPLSVSEEEGGMKAMMANSDKPDPTAISRHWILAAVYAIGGRYTGRNFDTITQYLEDIGPKGRKGLDMAFQHLHTLTTKQGEDIIASMQRRG